MGEIKEHQSHLQLICHDYNYKVYSLTKHIVDKQNYLIKGMLFMYLHQMLTSHETLTSSRGLLYILARFIAPIKIK